MRDAAAAAGMQTSDLAHVGVGSPGAIDAAAGTVSSASNLPGWSGTYPLGPALAEELGTPVALGNDVQVATDAEARLGAARELPLDARRLLGNGGRRRDRARRQAVGRLGAAGEIGHVCIQMRDGLRCPCGRAGCMEAYAGRSAMEHRARELHAEGRATPSSSRSRASAVASG